MLLTPPLPPPKGGFRPYTGRSLRDLLTPPHGEYYMLYYDINKGKEAR